MSLSKNINPSLVLVQPRKTLPYITERLLMGRKESNQKNNVAYQNKWNHQYSNMAANILLAGPPPSIQPWGSKGQNSTSSDHGNVAYQIKRNHKCSNIVANILHADTPHPHPPTLVVKIQLFQDMVMLHILSN